jgi:hypothetical protein
MKLIKNENGVALITALMFTALILVISMSLLYMVTVGTRQSGILKRYRSTIDAAYGGSDIVVKDIITTAFGFSDYSSAHPGSTFSGYMNAAMGTMNSPSFSNCLRQRLTLPRSQWSGGCETVTMDPKDSADISFNLNATSGSTYSLYSKIVDTMDRKFLVLDAGESKTVIIAGNSDTSGFVLDGVSTTGAAPITVPHYPYVYRIEIQGERQQNAVEKTNISILYAY